MLYNENGYISPNKAVNLPPHLMPQAFFDGFDSGVDDGGSDLSLAPDTPGNYRRGAPAQDYARQARSPQLQVHPHTPSAPYNGNYNQPAPGPRGQQGTHAYRQQAQQPVHPPPGGYANQGNSLVPPSQPPYLPMQQSHNPARSLVPPPRPQPRQYPSQSWTRSSSGAPPPAPIQAPYPTDNRGPPHQPPYPVLTLDPAARGAAPSQEGRLNSLSLAHSLFQIQHNAPAPPYPVAGPQGRSLRKAPLLTFHAATGLASEHQRRIASLPQIPNFPGALTHAPSLPQLPNSPQGPDHRTRLLTLMLARPQQRQQMPSMPLIPHGAVPSRRSPLTLLSATAVSGHTFSLLLKLRSFTLMSKLALLPSKKTSLTLLAQSPGGGLPQPKPKKPPVYPALLLAVARQFKESVLLTINTKDGLEYHDTFTGKMAVDIICRIIRTNDRNLALLLGRLLDAQKCFHDVTYQHRLRDSVHEVYAFSHSFNDAEFYSEHSQGSTLSKHGLFPGLAPGFEDKGVNGVFTILTDCYSPTCTRNRLCYLIACPRRLEQQARLNMKPQGGLRRAVLRLLLHEEENKTLWHETVPQLVLDNLDKGEKMRQELIYELIYTERDYVKDLEFMTDFYIMPLRNPANNIIPEHQREAFIHTVFGGVGELLRLAKQFSEALTRRQQQQKPVISTVADVFLDHVGLFDPFVRYLGNKVFANFEHERQQQVNPKYARFLDAIEKKPELRKQDLLSFLIKGVQRPARYQLLLNGILKHTPEGAPDHKNLIRAKEEIEKLLGRINTQTGELTDRHKVMVLHRLLGKQTLENKFNFKLNYNHRIIYQATLNRKRDNEKIDLYLFEHALLLVKHKMQNKRDYHKVYERPMYLGLLFVNLGIEIPTPRSIMSHRVDMLLVLDTLIKNRIELLNFGTGGGTTKYQINFLGLGTLQVHALLYAEDVTIQNQVLQQVYQQQKKLIEKNDFFTLSKYETRKFYGQNKINCALPFHGGKKLLYGTDLGLWLLTVRQISTTLTEKIVSDPTMVISKTYVTQIEVLVEYGKLLVLADKLLYEYDLSCTDLLDHVRNTRAGKLLVLHILFFKTGICDGKLLVCGARTGATHLVVIFEPANPFDRTKNKLRRPEITEVAFASDPVLISFLKTKLCIGCTKDFEILLLKDGQKEPILDDADPLLGFAIHRDPVTPLAIYTLNREFLLVYAEFVFLINRNGWRINHDWFISWEGTPQNTALFFPYLVAFEPGFVEIRDLHSTTLLRSLIGENIRFLYSNEHEAMYACEENGYDIIVLIDFLK